jgi:cytochrome P450
MQSFFWHVLADDRVHKGIIDEVDEAVRTGGLPTSGNVSWAQGQALPYLQACLKEAMRVRPAVGVNITRLVPPEGAELDGHFFPGGTRVAVNGWVLHRDRPMFGQDADEFRPERWTEDEERARRMERYMFQVRYDAERCSTLSFADLVTNSSEAARTCASGGIWRCWRSTRCCHGC